MADSTVRNPDAPLAVLFADISRSTALYAERGDAAAFALASKALAIVEQRIATGGGVVVKRLGDGVLATFADPSNAIHAAAAARGALTEPDATVQREGVQLRFGISYGPAMVTPQDVFGDVVNVAARLVEIAGPDEILLSGSTYEALAPALRGQARAIDQLVLRNRPAPVLVYEFIGDEEDATVGIGNRIRAAATVLEITHGERVFVIGPERPRLTIGREARHDIQLDHHAVSRLHAEIVVRGDKFVLIDRSTNGTYVYVADAPVLRVMREELALPARGHITAGVEGGRSIAFRLVAL
jgi:adenylate cyclase